ncbi:MAG: hypothetical protein AAGH64_05370 [Planctomycetota bacterium]
MLALLATAPATPPPASTSDPGAPSAASVQVLLLGVSVAVVVLLIAIGLLVLIRVRRSIATPRREAPAEQESPWAIAGGRAAIDEDDGLGGVVIGDDDTDPNEDTWAGLPPG